jgi:taurine dioxygenase
MSIAEAPTHGNAVLSVKKLTPAIGAVVESFDLAQDHDDAAIAAIRRALDENLVLFFENQTLTPAQQRDFAARFGKLYVHPVYPGQDGLPEIMVLEFDAERRGSNDVWHSDVTYVQAPPQASLFGSDSRSGRRHALG